MIEGEHNPIPDREVPEIKNVSVPGIIYIFTMIILVISSSSISIREERKSKGP
jgi:hypothetical protein